jgi:hypothetical protein
MKTQRLIALAAIMALFTFHASSAMAQRPEEPLTKSNLQVLFAKPTGIDLDVTHIDVQPIFSVVYGRSTTLFATRDGKR